MLLEVVYHFISWLCSSYYISTILVGLLVFNILRWWIPPHPRFPPGFWGLPFVGATPFVTSMPHKNVHEWSKKYGPIFSVKFMSRYTVFLMEYELIQDAFSKHGPEMSDRPIIPVLYQVNKGKGILDQNYNSTFKTHRRNGGKIFKGLGSIQVSMDKVVALEGDYLVKHLKQQCGQPIDIMHVLYHATGNAIAQIALGKRYGYSDPEFQSLLNGVLGVTEDPNYSKKLMVTIFLPFLRYVPPFKSNNDKFINLNMQIFAFIQKQIDLHLETLNPTNIRDFIDVYIADNVNVENPKTLDSNVNTELLGFVKDLFFAGIETTSITITWAVVSLLNFPEVHKKLQTELDSVVGPDENITIAHRESLPYTCAFIQEVMRYHTLVPMGIPHLTSTDVDFHGYRIPKNTQIQGHIWGVHNDPKNWPEPGKFDPMRHMDNSGQFVFSKKVIPFSVGIRRCIGESLARAEVFVFIATLIKHFSISCVSDKGPPPMDKGTLALFIYCPTPFKVILDDRCARLKNTGYQE